MSRVDIIETTEGRVQYGGSEVWLWGRHKAEVALACASDAYECEYCYAEEDPIPAFRHVRYGWGRWRAVRDDDYLDDESELAFELVFCPGRPSSLWRRVTVVYHPAEWQRREEIRAVRHRMRLIADTEFRGWTVRDLYAGTWSELDDAHMRLVSPCGRLWCRLHPFQGGKNALIGPSRISLCSNRPAVFDLWHRLRSA